MGEKKKAENSAHKALYRKYRSKSLSEVLGQEHVTKTLENALKQGKIGHAYLFTGPRGTGKTSIARILAHEINNLPYTDETTHLDIIEIDAASNRRIDDIRDLRDKVHIVPVSAKYKIYIIDEVHMLTTESFNALLKTLEEPPEHVIFFLATTEVHKLPATILSRTQRFSLKLASEDTVTKHLEYIATKEGFDFEQEALGLLAAHGGGSFRDSVSLLDQLGSSGEKITVQLVELLLGIAPKKALFKLLQSAQSGDSKETLTQMEHLIQSGLTPSGIAAQLLSLLRENAKNGRAEEDSVKLMSDLLLVNNAQYPQLKLETILLSLRPKENQGANITSSTLTSGEKKAESPPKEEAVPHSEKVETMDIPKEKAETAPPVAKKNKLKPASVDTESLLKEWPAILTETKKQNNPLYTVLRLASPEVNGDELVLFFNFPFHQKKLEEPKNKALITAVVKDTTGTSFVITTMVDKTKVKPTVETVAVPPTDPAHASLISNVQDIMGGGEVVNV